MSTAVGIARRFAESLDAEDYATTEALLSDACEYACRGQVYKGPRAIIESYQSVGDSAHDVLDSIEYESSVEAVAGNRVRIHFVDHICHNNRRFTFRCQQLVDVDDDGLITRIEHIDLPGQKDALNAFMRQADRGTSHGE